MRKYFFFASVFFLSISIGSSCFATDITPLTTFVGDLNVAEQVGVDVKVFDTLECAELKEAYIQLPKLIHNSELNTTIMQIEINGQVISYSALPFIEAEDYKGFDQFHGVYFCFHDLDLTQIEVTVSYANQHFVTDVLVIPFNVLVELRPSL